MVKDSWHFFETHPLRAVGSNHVAWTDFNPFTIPPHILRAVARIISILYVSFLRNSKFLLSLLIGLKSGATIWIAPPELVLTVLLYFIRALCHKSVNCLLKHALFILNNAAAESGVPRVSFTPFMERLPFLILHIRSIPVKSVLRFPSSTVSQFYGITVLLLNCHTVMPFSASGNRKI